MPRTAPSRGRSVIITWFTSLDELPRFNHLAQNFISKGSLRLLYGQLEICPTTQRPHLQLYATRANGASLRSWVAMLSNSDMPRAHVKFVTQTPEKAREYVRKDDTRWSDDDGTEWYIEHGAKPKGAGHRSDIDQVKDLILRSEVTQPGVYPNANEIMFSDTLSSSAVSFAARSRAFLSDVYYHRRKALKLPRDPLVVVLHGQPGTGKTFLALALTPDPVIMGDNQLHWYFPYSSGDKHVVFDDIDKASTPPLATLKRVLDRYPHTGAIKGGNIDWAPDLIVLCTNENSLSDCYDSLSATSVAAIARRVHLDIDTDQPNWQRDKN